MGMNRKITQMYKPSRKLYITLLCISMIVSLLCLIIPITDAWFTIVAGIGCGGIASTIVGWLIDEANCRKDLERVENNRNLLLRKLYNAFDYGLQPLIYHTVTVSNDNSPREWVKWVEASYQIASSDPKFCNTFNKCLNVFFDDIAEQTYELNTQTALLLEHGLIEASDANAISSVLSFCDMAKTEMNSSEDNTTLSRNLKTYTFLMSAFIDSSANMRFINETMIEPTIYNISVKHK